jgi:hypothetical protein
MKKILDHSLLHLYSNTAYIKLLITDATLLQLFTLEILSCLCMVYSGMLVFQRAHMSLTQAKPLTSQMRTNIYNTLMVIQTTI